MGVPLTNLRLPDSIDIMLTQILNDFLRYMDIHDLILCINNASILSFPLLLGDLVTNVL